jgi:ppGpp synthetase/RelA/SpoT-type nucleotidyltranferase
MQESADYESLSECSSSSSSSSSDVFCTPLALDNKEREKVEEQTSMKSTCPKRKRQKSIGGSSSQFASIIMVASAVVALSLLASTTPVSGFYTLRVSHAQRRIVANQGVVELRFATVTEVVPDEVLVDNTSKDTLVLSRGARESILDVGNGINEMPPWQRRGEKFTAEQAESEIDWLEYTLLEHRFAVDDITEVSHAIRLVSAGDRRKIVGCVDFCRLIVRLEEPGTQSYGFVTKDVLLASILHYAECVTARQQGVYRGFQRAIEGSKDQEPPISLASLLPNNADAETSPIGSSSKVASSTAVQLRKPLSKDPLLLDTQQIFSDDVLRLARGASILKRAEILADVILTGSRSLTKSEYSDVRDMLLSVMEDWRALAIRCVACLYRLEGIADKVDVGAAQYLQRSPSVILAARESIRVYANLAQRLGMHRLKSQLESLSFRILYPRQFSAVSTLFRQKGESMNAVSSYLSAQISNMLREDQSLMVQIEDLQISARVKEPYSFWRKLLKKRLGQSASPTDGSLLHPSSEISIIEVQDGVALRVILKARKWESGETDDSRRSRERMLCYYVHHLIRRRWPALDESRVKDYIQAPKPNGYQSLHFTSSITRNRQEFPFEVQVRSEEMHRIAEYGVAAHWDYKLGSKNLPALTAPSQRKSSNEAGENAYIDALVTARMSLVGSTVYVFLAGSSTALEEGKLLSLPVGAKVSDALTELCKNLTLPNTCSHLQVWRNGQLARLDECLGNGDVVLLFRNENKSLSPASVLE